MQCTSFREPLCLRGRMTKLTDDQIQVRLLRLVGFAVRTTCKNLPAIGWRPHCAVRIDSDGRTALQFVFSPTSVIAVGKLMFVFPEVVARLDILEAAGQIIAEGRPGPVLVLLPFGSTTTRTVTVQGRGFAGIVPIQVVLTPENGVPVVYPADIDMSLSDPAQVIVDVEIPVNTLTRIDAWRR